MEIGVLKNVLARVTAENKLLKFVVVIIALSNVYFGSLAYRALQEKKVVLYPVGYCGKTVVGDRKPDPAYVLQMSRFVFDSLLTFTPSSIRKQYEAVLAVFAPQSYEKYKKAFERYIDDVIVSKISSVFFIDRLEHMPKKNLVRASGRRVIFYADQPIETKSITFAFTYRYHYGEFRILEYGKFSSVQKRILSPEEEEKEEKKGGSK